MRRHHALLYVLLATLLSLAVQFPTARAAITTSGNVIPAPPWNSYYIDGFIGGTSDGTLTADSGSDLLCRDGSIGYNWGVAGIVTIDGAGSTWTNMNLYIGRSGNGTLNITGGGAVISYYSGNIGFGVDSVGVVKVNGTDSTWTISDHINVGYIGDGTLNITGGAAVRNRYDGTIGFYSGTIGVVTVDGAGSILESGNITVGVVGSGRLNITGGGAVRILNYGDSYIGKYAGWGGVVAVDGADSEWTNNYDLYIGDSGSGALYISGGGTVSAASVSINSQSLLAIDAGKGSLLNVGSSGSGTINNDGTVRILAGAGVAANEPPYSPIAAGTWDGSGIYQAVGGTWNETTHEFTVSGVQSGNFGTPLTIDLADTQRVSINDGGTGWSVGASFLAADVSTTLDFTATAIEGDALDGLVALLDSGQSVMGAWEFIVAGDGYTEGDPAYLSFDIGAGYSRNGLQVWHFDGTDWTEFDAMDLTYDGAYASFTVTGFSGYAVSAVPEPGTLFLLISAALGLLTYRRKK